MTGTILEKGKEHGWQNSLDDVSPQVGTYWNEDMLTDESYWHINDYQTLRLKKWAICIIRRPEPGQNMWQIR